MKMKYKSNMNDTTKIIPAFSMALALHGEF
jgi:hypothetical protein